VTNDKHIKLFYVLLCTGLRLNEAYSSKLEHISDNKYHVSSLSKNSKDHDMYILGNHNLVVQYKKDIGDQYIKSGFFDRKMKKICNEYDINSPKDLRDINTAIIENQYRDNKEYLIYIR